MKLSISAILLSLSACTQFAEADLCCVSFARRLGENEQRELQATEAPCNPCTDTCEVEQGGVTFAEFDCQQKEVGDNCQYTCEEESESEDDGGAGGDPHFKTWGGSWYDYHGVCDLVLVRSEEFGNGSGLSVHVRTQERYGYSFIETASIQMGEDILEISSFGEYFLNGVEGAHMPAAMGTFPVTYTMLNEKSHRFYIALNEDKEEIVVTTFKDMVSIVFKHTSFTDFGTSKGLMGAYADGSLVARDGSTVMEDLNAFGQEWQVLDSEPMLFQSIRGPQGPHQKCVLPERPTEDSRRRLLGEDTVTQEAAQLACAHFKEQDHQDRCVFDVMAMNDLEIADVHGAF